MLSDDLMHTLYISQVAADDAGTFTVVASNSLGTASHSARLSVDFPSLKRRQLELDHCPVNVIAEPAASRQPWKPVSTRSPRSFDSEPPASSTWLKMMPGYLSRLSLCFYEYFKYLLILFSDA